MKIKFRLLREGGEVPARIITEEFDSIVSAAQYAKRMMNEKIVDSLEDAVRSEVVVVDWSKITIAYVEPIE
jgi:hypothetical protein